MRVLIIIIIFSTTIFSQVNFINRLSILSVSADGTERLVDELAESEAEDIYDLLLSSIPAKKGIQEVILLNEETKENGEQNILKSVTELHKEVDSTHLCIINIFGAWNNTDEDMIYNLETTHHKTITAEYLLNLLLFLRSNSTLCVLISPQKYSFPEEFLNNKTDVLPPGKYILNIKNDAERDYYETAYEFIDLFEEALEEENYDLDRDKMLSFSEMLSALNMRLKAELFNFSFYQLSSGDDIMIKIME